MSWIKIIKYEDADANLKRIYDRVKGPDRHIDNVLSIHSLRPHSLVGHMTLYKNVLHNANNTLPKWYLEAIGVYVSYLNGCDYCVQHHFEGFKRLVDDDDRAELFLSEVKSGVFTSFFDTQQTAGIEYAWKLTAELKRVVQQDVENLKMAGFSEGEILELNQVISYFNYVNRTVLGLGVNIDGEVLGRSPGDSADPNNWKHQ